MQQKQQFDENKIRTRVSSELRTAFPQVFNLNRKQFAAVAGVTAGHISNCEIKNEPLVTPVHEGKKPLYPLPEVIDYLVEQRLKTMKRGAGRPTKAERIAAASGGAL